MPGGQDDDAAEAEHLERKIAADVHVLDLPVWDRHFLFVQDPALYFQRIIAEANL